MGGSAPAAWRPRMQRRSAVAAGGIGLRSPSTKLLCCIFFPSAQFLSVLVFCVFVVVFLPPPPPWSVLSLRACLSCFPRLVFAFLLSKDAKERQHSRGAIMSSEWSGRARASSLFARLAAERNASNKHRHRDEDGEEGSPGSPLFPESG
ncbi:hypothetical protein MRX96_011230 [Rhipicephalus microplus]